MRKIITLMLLGLSFLHVWAQDRTITGKVVDNAGVPISSASVLVKGTQIGTSTDSEGVFSIAVPGTARTLTISAVGYAPFDVAIGQRSNIEVSLQPQNADLDEVVVVAYGTARRSEFIGSAGTVSAREIEKRPVANVTRAIEGNVPGVVVTTGSGQPGNGSAIRIRGFGSFSASQDPLYVVDGVPYVGGLSNLNPDDIESLTVLKDASATTLYGARAGNGVVLITTKRGKKGSNGISVKVQQGVTQRGIPEYDRVNAFEYYPLMWEAYRNSLHFRNGGISLDSASRVASGLTSRDGIDALLAYNPFNVPRNQIVDVNGNINPSASLLYPDDQDWTDFFMSNGYRQEYNLNFNGGAEKMDYFMSLGYLGEDGFTRNTDFDRFSARMNINVQPLKWLKTGLNFAGNSSTFNLSNEGGAIANPFQFSRNLGPIYPYWARNMTTGDLVLDDRGNRIWDLGNFQNEPIGIQNGIRNRPGTTAGRHAPAELELNINRLRRQVLSVRQYTDLYFTKELKFTANFGYDFNNEFTEGYENQLVGDGAPAGRADKVHDINRALLANQLLNYKKTFAAKHTVDLLAGHESFQQVINNMRGFRQGQSLSGNIEFGNFTTINTLTSVEDNYRIESWFGRVNYDFNNLLYLSGSIRTDGNSRFSRDSRWGTFWSVGAGIALDKLDFFSNVGWLNSLRLRGSYGTVGVADGIGFYAYQGLYGFANNANEPGIVQSQTAVENLNLTWEVNKQADIGLDFSLFKNRLSGTFEWYNRVSSDLLFAVPTPLSSGFLSTTQNTATMFNRGIELALNGSIIQKRNFEWKMGLQFTTINNQITKMPEGIPEFISGTKKYSVGASLFDYWLRSWYGVDPDDGAALYHAQNTTASSGIRYKTNKDGGIDTVTTEINNGRFDYHGGVIPDFYGAMNQEFRYKNFSLSVLFTFQQRGLTYDGAYQTLMSAGTYGSAVHKDILNRWTTPGQVTNVPRMDNGQLNNFNATSSRWLIDASYFNIRTITFNYALPSALVSKWRMKNASVFLSGENVAFFSKRRGMNNQNAFSGITSSAYPVARVISGGLSINL